MTGWLVKIGLAGVQEQIADARMLRDLGAGSRLVSRCAMTAADTLAAAGATILLPAGTGPSHPHQTVARVEGDEAIVRGLLDTAVATASAWWAKALQPCGAPGALENAWSADPDAVSSQLASALEQYWVAIPETGDYRADYARLQRLYDDRRRSRTFDQPQFTAEATRRRYHACAQCGRRDGIVAETILYGKVPGRRSLCAVCAGKRVWSFSELPSFPSTHALARARYATDHAFDAMRSRLEAAGVGVAKQRSAVEQLTSPESASEGSPTADDPGDGARGAALFTPDERRMLDLELGRYYALLLVDGDRMGRWLAGEWSAGADLEASQSTLSASLAAFAGAIARLAKSVDATVVYAGGDDAMLLTPLDGLFPLLTGVHDLWHTHVATGSSGVGGRLPTVTAHAMVLHEKQPLQPALREARSALERAKEIMDRDAFSILVQPHAGGSAELLAEWDELENLIQAVEAVSTWRGADGTAPPQVADLEIRLGTRCPARLYYTIEREAAGFFDSDGKLGLRDAFARELDRLVGRSEASRSLFTPTRDWLVERAGYGVVGGRRPGSQRGRDALLHALRVASFLARQLEWGRP